jgi:hypothetical protein
MEIMEMKVNKFIEKLKNFFSRRWNTRCNRAFVEGVNDDVSMAVRLHSEHFFEAFHHGTITRLPYSAIVCRVELVKSITTGIGASRKLNEERRKQVLQFLFIDIPEVEIKVSD